MTTIRISDIGTTAEYHLDGDRLSMRQTGGCADALNENGCQISESMDDTAIESAVYSAWCQGYDGSPEANDLHVTVIR